MECFSLRLANENDLDLLFDWVNEPEVRANSFNTGYIDYETHSNWFKNILKSEDEIIYIFQAKDKPIGQIRFKIENNSACISYSIAANERGNGYSKKMMSMAMEQIALDYPNVKHLYGNVKPENEASIQCFKSLGFIKNYENFIVNLSGKSSETGGAKDRLYKALCCFSLEGKAA